MFRALDSQVAPEELAAIGRAFEQVCKDLGIASDDHAAERERVARLILKLAAHGKSDAALLRAEATQELRASHSSR
jgi:hypothetical protein